MLGPNNAKRRKPSYLESTLDINSIIYNVEYKVNCNILSTELKQYCSFKNVTQYIIHRMTLNYKLLVLFVVPSQSLNVVVI